MTPAEKRTGRSDVLGIGIIAAFLTVVSALMALVSVALYRVEREEIDGDSNTGFVPESGR